jgi:tRNA(Arg) A34 adenosine deaminase TadA
MREGALGKLWRVSTDVNYMAEAMAEARAAQARGEVPIGAVIVL